MKETLFNKLKNAAIQNLPFLGIKEDSSELEVVSAFENAKPQAEPVDNTEQLNALQSRIENLENVEGVDPENFATKEDLESQSELTKAQAEKIKALEAQNTALETKFAGLTKELNDLKGRSSGNAAPGVHGQIDGGIGDPRPNGKGKVIKVEQEKVDAVMGPLKSMKKYLG